MFLQVSKITTFFLLFIGIQGFAVTPGGVPREAFENPELYYSLSQPEIQEITQEELFRLNPGFRANEVIDFGQCDENIFGRVQKNNASESLSELGIYLDQIINIGKKIWNIVAAGSPVANFKADVAYALPRGVTCWNQLSGWSMPASRTYKVTYKNKFGVEVIQYAYQITFTHGGQFQQQGAYITNASILPAHINVAWGFQFDATAEVPSVFNIGTMQEPVGGMQLMMSWKITNILTHEQKTETFYINGRGDIQKLSE